MKRKKALVIDDEEVVLKSVGHILAAEGYDVDTSQSGRQGLDWALQRPYDVVLTDIRMPDIGGITVLRDIKKAKPSLPVVIVTGYATMGSATQALKLGASEYLEKPFTPDELSQAVSKAITMAAATRPEDEGRVHKEEIIKVLEKTVSDPTFGEDMVHRRADSLSDYDLSGPEKLAILTGDIEWIENQIGPLTEPQRRWLELRKNTDIW